MTLGEALTLVQQRKAEDRRRKIFLACGFQPLHLGTFVQAHFAARFSNESAEIITGLYGDLQGTLRAGAASDAEAVALIIEWSDLDPRLGLRSAGGWAISVQPDIIETCRKRLAGLLESVRSVAESVPVALVPPTLPATLFGHTAGWQGSIAELDLQKELAAFLAEASRISGVSVLNSSRLARSSPETSRQEALMELKAGFPYSLGHAAAVAEQLVKLMFPPAPLKGLITDLDDTFWAGIVGEAGVQNVSWTLAEHTAIHGLYQQMLAHLGEMGVLLAVASKNDSAVASAALLRDDLMVPANLLFPVCANWGPKSTSVAEILNTWNIGADSVVFVDDSPMELEEVRSAFPGITCLQFSSRQPGKTLQMLEQLRDLFGKPAIQQEDGIRHAGIRAGVTIRSSGEAGSEFLRGLSGKVTFDRSKDPNNKRLLELNNKTNQFNLNGVRYTEGEWLRYLADPASVVLSISYEDKFGPLGVIGVVAGKRTGSSLEISVWVMSCRAFSRRIEFHTADYLLNSYGVESISLCPKATERNEPLFQFLRSICPAEEAGSAWTISRETFGRGNHYLPHTVEVRDAREPGLTGKDDPSTAPGVFVEAL